MVPILQSLYNWGKAYADGRKIFIGSDT
ncbi:hypothetical protein [Fulvivirga ulvae]